MTDIEILLKINANDTDAIEKLYDKYSPNVFGIINLLSKNKLLNEFMLMQLFTNLKQDIKPGFKCVHLPAWLYSYTFKFALNELCRKGIEPNTEGIKNSPVLIQRIYNTFLAGQQSTEEVKVIKMDSETVPSSTPQYNWLPIYGNNPYTVK